MPSHSWKKTPGWRNHGFACFDSEWATYKLAAETAGKPVNKWIREWLSEAVKYERLASRNED